MVPNVHLSRLINPEKITICLLDDFFACVDNSVQAASYGLIHGRQINNITISDKVRFVALTNDFDDFSGVSNVLSALKSRFSTILKLEYDYKSYSDYLTFKGYDDILISFIEFKKNLLKENMLVSNSLEVDFNCRVYETFCIKYPFIKNDSLFFEIACSSIGITLASEFLAYRDKLNKLPKFNDVIANPENYREIFMSEPIYANMLVNICINRINVENIDTFSNAIEKCLGQEFHFLFFNKFAILLEKYHLAKKVNNMEIMHSLKHIDDCLNSKNESYKKFIEKNADYFVS
jgi:hypothetical protein